VLHHHSRVARDMAAEVAGEDARVEVVAAARAEPDDEVHGLAAVEIGDALGGCAAGRQRQRGRDKGQGGETGHGQSSSAAILRRDGWPEPSLKRRAGEIGDRLAESCGFAALPAPDDECRFKETFAEMKEPGGGAPGSVSGTAG